MRPDRLELIGDGWWNWTEDSIFRPVPFLDLHPFSPESTKDTEHGNKTFRSQVEVDAGG